jgi:hypothetical protein
MAEVSQHSATSASRGEKKKKKPAEMATVSQTLAFAFDCGSKNVLLFCIGVIGAVGNGAVRIVCVCVCVYLCVGGGVRELRIHIVSISPFDVVAVVVVVVVTMTTEMTISLSLSHTHSRSVRVCPTLLNILFCLLVSANSPSFRSTPSWPTYSVHRSPIFRLRRTMV